LSYLSITVFRQLTEEKEKRKIRGMFANTLSPTLVDQLIENPSLAEVGGEHRELTCMFSDLAGFTAMSERLGPQETVKLLNRYFDRMTAIVQNRCGGYLNKFLGDGIFVFFGAPVFQEDRSARGLRAAIECHQEVSQFNIDLENETGINPNLEVRVGITTGEVMVGNYGSTERYDYTAIGDPVNLSSRLESSCKFFGAGIICDDRTLRKGGDDSIASRPLGKIRIKGIREGVSVHEIFGYRKDVPDIKLEIIRPFSDAVRAIEKQDFIEAERLLKHISDRDPTDTAAGIYLAFCREHVKRGQDPGAPEYSDPNGVVQLKWTT